MCLNHFVCCTNACEGVAYIYLQPGIICDRRDLCKAFFCPDRPDVTSRMRLAMLQCARDNTRDFGFESHEWFVKKRKEGS